MKTGVALIAPAAAGPSRRVGGSGPGVVGCRGSGRHPEQILDAAEVHELLDLDQPVGVLVVALFHFIPDADDPAGILARLTAPLASGSALVLSHATDDEQPHADEAREIYRRSGIDLTLRSRAQVTALFGDIDLVEPGVVWVPQWRPESARDLYHDRPEASAGYAGVGRRR